jgi:hypothetical protein
METKKKKITSFALSKLVPYLPLTQDQADVLRILVDHWPGAHPSIPTIAFLAKIGQPRVRRAIKQLILLGYLLPPEDGHVKGGFQHRGTAYRVIAKKIIDGYNEHGAEFKARSKMRVSTPVATPSGNGRRKEGSNEASTPSATPSAESTTPVATPSATPVATPSGDGRRKEGVKEGMKEGEKDTKEGEKEGAPGFFCEEEMPSHIVGSSGFSAEIVSEANPGGASVWAKLEPSCPPSYSGRGQERGIPDNVRAALKSIPKSPTQVTKTRQQSEPEAQKTAAKSQQAAKAEPDVAGWKETTEGRRHPEPELPGLGEPLTAYLRQKYVDDWKAYHRTVTQMGLGGPPCDEMLKRVLRRLADIELHPDAEQGALAEQIAASARAESAA